MTHSLKIKLIPIFLFTFQSLAQASELSPVGRESIVFSRVTDGYWQLWTLDEGKETQRTSTPSDKRNPIWIAGKPEVLFNTSDNRLFKVNLETAQEEQIMPELGQLGEASFTPDGKSLIYTLIDENVKDASNLWQLDLATQKRVLLTQDPGLQYSPRVSEDGRSVNRKPDQVPRGQVSR